MPAPDHNTFLAASDAGRFIIFGVLMTLLLGSVAWASFVDERKASKARAHENEKRTRES
jgi:hypothetical protein